MKCIPSQMAHIFLKLNNFAKRCTLALVVVLLVGITSNAAVLTVDADGGADYTSVTAAFAAVANGDTIKFVGSDIDSYTISGSYPNVGNIVFKSEATHPDSFAVLTFTNWSTWWSNNAGARVFERVILDGTAAIPSTALQNSSDRPFVMKNAVLRGYSGTGFITGDLKSNVIAIENSLFYNNSGTIFKPGNPNNTNYGYVKNSTFYGNSGIIYDDAINHGSAALVTFTNVVFVGSQTIANDADVTEQWTYCLIPSSETTTNWGTGYVQSDSPGFVNGSGSFSKPSDFDILSNSPARDVGTNASMPTEDIRGNARNGTYDIGAWEYIPMDLTWDASADAGIQGGGGTWGTDDFWTSSDGFIRWIWLPGYNAIFAGGNGTYAVTVNGTQQVNAITVDNTGYTLSGGTLNFDGSTPYIIANADVSIGSAITGTGGLGKSGSGIATLSGGNNITIGGAIQVQEGTLQLVDADALAVGSSNTSFNIASGATLEFNASTGQIRLGSDAVGGTVISGSGTLEKTGASALTLGNQGASGYNAHMNMTGGLIDIQEGTLKNGGWQGGVWTNNKASMNIAAGATLDLWDGIQVKVDALTGSGTITQQLNVDVTNSIAVGVNNGSGTWSGVLEDGLGTNLLYKQGTGTLTLNSANTFSGGTTLQGGGLIVAHSNALGTGDLTVNGSGYVSFNGSVINVPNNIVIQSCEPGGSGVIRSGSGAWPTISGSVTVNAECSDGGPHFRTTGSTATITGGLNSNGSAVPLHSGGTLVISGGGNAHRFNQTGGTLRLGAENGLPTTMVFTQMHATNTTWFDLNGFSQSFAAIASVVNASNNIYNSGALVTLSITGSVDTVYHGNITGAIALTKSGTGTLTVAGNNTYTGTTTISEGTLQIGDGGTTGTIGDGTGDVAIMTGAKLVFNRSTDLTVTNGLPGNDQNRRIEVNGSGVITFNAGNIGFSGASTFSLGGSGTGVMGRTLANSGSTGHVVKDGSGSWTITNTGNYSENMSWTITEGTLHLGASGVMYDNNTLILNGGTFSTGAGVGYSEQLGTMQLSATSTIALGTGDHTLTFANSSAVAWAGDSLHISGWLGVPGSSGTAGKIMVGVGGLSAAQLAKVTFAGFEPGGEILGTGELVPLGVPPVVSTLEPANLSSGVASRKGITITFDKEVVPATGNVVIRRVSDNTIFETIDVSLANVAFDFEATNQGFSTATQTTERAYMNSGSVKKVASAHEGIFWSRSPGDWTKNWAEYDSLIAYVYMENISDGAGYMQLVTKTNEWNWVANGGINPVVNTWNRLAYSLQDATQNEHTVDPSDINELGVQVGYTGTYFIDKIMVKKASPASMTFFPTQIFEDNEQYYVEIDAGAITDVYGVPYGGISGSGTWDFSVQSAPTDISLSEVIVTEEQSVGTLVGVLSATDPDVGDTHKFFVGGTDNSQFYVSNDSLYTNAIFDYAVKSSYAITMGVTDHNGTYFDKGFTITVREKVEAPTLVATTLESAVSVELSTTTAGATIYYTDDGTEPTAGSTQYVGAIDLATTKTIKAIAIKAGAEDSEILTEEVQVVQTNTPVIGVSDVIGGKQVSMTVSSNAASFNDDHSVDNLATDWAITGARTWSINTASGYVFLPNDVDNQSFFINNTETGDDGSFTVELDLVSGMDEWTVEHIGLVFRYTNSSNYYFLRLRTWGDNVRVYKNSTSANAVFAYNTAISLGNIYTVKVEMEGSTFTIFLNGVEVGSFTDADNPSGKVGYANNGFAGAEGAVRFRSSAWQDLAGAPPVIYYTEDGVDPTTASTQYAAPFVLTQSKTVKAIAKEGGFVLSDIATQAITVDKVATPTITSTPVATGQQVTLASATAGVTIYYTDDGTAPTVASTEYAGAFTITETKTIRAIAVKSGMATSDEASTAVTVTFEYTWDALGDANVQAGSGTWGTDAFWTPDNGVSRGAWPGSGYHAVFGGMDGTAGDYAIEVNGTQSVTSMSFMNDGYVLNNGIINFGTNDSIFLENGKTVTINSVIAGSGGLSIHKSEAGSTTTILELQGVNTYTGPTAIHRIMRVNAPLLTNGGIPSSIGASGNAAENLILDGGTLRYTGGEATTDRLFTLQGNAERSRIYTSGTGTLSFTNTGAVAHSGTGNRELELGGSVEGVNHFYPLLSNPADGVTSLRKTGTTTWLLYGDHTYTGGTDIQVGMLQIGDGGATGSLTGSTSIASGATLFINRANYTHAGLISGEGQVRLRNQNAGTPAFTLTNANTFSGNLILADGIGDGTRLRIESEVVTVGTAGAITSSPFGTGSIIIGESPTDNAGILFDVYANNTLVNDVVFNTILGTDQLGIRIDNTGNTLAGTITANLSDALFMTPSTLSGTATLTGRVTGSNGLRVQAPTAGGALSITLANAAQSNDYAGNTLIEHAGATVRLGVAEQIPHGAGKGNLVVEGLFALDGFSETVNGLSGDGIVDGVSGSPVLTLGANDATATFTGALQNTSGNLSLVKTGSGVQTLSGTNTFTGTTTVSAGSLLVNGSLASGSAVSVQNGATLGGSGTVAGTVAVASGATLAPGATAGVSIATLSTGAVSFVAGATFSVDLDGTVPTFDQLNSTGAVTLGNATLTVANIANAAAAKVYTIVSGGSISGTFNGLANGSTFVQQGRTFQIAYTGTTVTLTDVTGVGSSTKTWTGGGSDNNWTNPANWGGLAPLAGDALVFAGTTRLAPNNDYAAGTSFSSIRFNAGAGNFVVGGNDLVLSGGTSALVNATSSGTMVINNNVTFSTLAPSISTFNGGTTHINGDVNNGGMNLTVDSSGTAHLYGILSGAGNLTINTAIDNVTLLSGVNTFSGDVTVTKGGIRIQNSQGLGLGNKTITMRGNEDFQPSLRLDGSSQNISLGSNIALSLSAYHGLYGGIINEGGDNSIAGYASLRNGGGDTRLRVDVGTLTVTGDWVGVNEGRQLRLDGAEPGFFTGALLDDGGWATGLIKNGSGTWTISANSANTGSVTVNEGILKIASTSALGASSGVAIGSGATIDLNGVDYVTALPLQINGLGVSNTGALINSNTTSATYAGLISLAGGASVVGGNGAINLTNTGAIIGSDYDLVLGGNVGGSLASSLATGAGGLSKVDAGTWVLSGASSFTGATTISAGSLVVTGSLAAGSAVSVQSGATLGGSGTVAGEVTVDNGGIVAPGVSGVGTLATGSLV
jgi:fibronectin-binding autotransporter adhesin